MEEWELDFNWLQLRHEIKDRFQKDGLPDLNAILFLIGINEVGVLGPFSKEQKQDLMHVAVCRLLEGEGLYEEVGKDDDGWPHFEQVKQLRSLDNKDQESLLKRQIISYFQKSKVI